MAENLLLAMNDIEALTLRAFLAALSQAAELPSEVVAQLRAIARDLEPRIPELDRLADQHLQPAYRLAYDALANSAAERGMGLDYITTSPDPDERSTATDNEIPSANAAPKMIEVLAKLRDWDKAQLEEAAPQVFNAIEPRPELFSLLGY
ncbi:MAG: hypothetical protein HC910_18915 [Spirulinaceae cyanobacterium SM2_1_0]|nr:hypothetical protein [Spirulinaceae cyanobacterium SM2_1_0]